MPIIPALIVLSVVVGLSVFALDFYKNRQRLSQPATEPSVDPDMHGLDALLVDGDDLYKLEGVTDQVIHSAGTGIGHLIEGLSHHLP